MRLEDRTPAFSRAASCWRYSIAAMRRSTARTLSRYSSSFCWSVRTASGAGPSRRRARGRASADQGGWPGWSLQTCRVCRRASSGHCEDRSRRERAAWASGSCSASSRPRADLPGSPCESGASWPTRARVTPCAPRPQLAMIWSAEIAMLTRLRVPASGSVAVSQVDSSNACGAPLNGEIGTPEMPFIIRHWSRTGRSDLMAGGGDLRKVFGTLGPELIHDDAVWHVHEPEPHRRLGRRATGLRPGHRIQERQREGNPHAFQAGAAIDTRETAEFRQLISLCGA